MRLATTGRVRSARAARVARAAGSRRRDRSPVGHGYEHAFDSTERVRRRPTRPDRPGGRRSGSGEDPGRHRVPAPPTGAAPVWLSGAMDYRTLGTTGVQVSRLCLGAMMFGAWGNPDHDDSVRIIHRAVDAGINFIDTADMYSFGESEVIVGKALQSLDRDQRRARHQGARGHVRRPQRPGQLTSLGDRRVRAQPATPRRRPHRPLPDPPAVARDRHRRHARRAERPGPRGQDPLRRLLHLPGPPGGRVALGGRTAGPRAVPDRAAPVLDPRPRHRGRPAAGLPDVRDGRAQLEPARRGLAVGGVRRGQAEHLPALGHAARSATTCPSP